MGRGRESGSSDTSGGAGEGEERPSRSRVSRSQVSRRRDAEGTCQPRALSAAAPASLGKPTVSLPAFRFPNLFPPLKPETVARRTVEAVQLNQALLLLPWTMHVLIILKRYEAAEQALGQAPANRPWTPWGRGRRQEKVTRDPLVMFAVGVGTRSGGLCAKGVLS